MTSSVSVFQLPLSGSRIRLSANCNSLTILSTPSLGITHGFQEINIIYNKFFQLPLSGSLDIFAESTSDIGVDFQLPLSGSLNT